MSVDQGRVENAPTHLVAMLNQTVFGPQAFIVGDSERVHLRAKGRLRPRHVVVICHPRESGVSLRITSLHPDNGMVSSGENGGVVGGVVAHGKAEVVFDGLRLTLQATLENAPEIEFQKSTRRLSLGHQLSFQKPQHLRPVGVPLSSFCGSAGHAIPALMQGSIEGSPLTGSLVLHSRDGVHETHPSNDELRQGLLIGRSRRCVLGQGFDENDGLSRVHALVMLLGERVFAFDLASRYGLRDISRPGKVVSSALLDNGAGVLVYGAGHLLFETA
ncbi:MAG: hypothetical protein GY822_22685 [Deltaproteobacteria bacterium]|nr:hypothetical protein [Deltaproteobacteria bacterium]